MLDWFNGLVYGLWILCLILFYGRLIAEVFVLLIVLIMFYAVIRFVLGLWGIGLDKSDRSA